LFGRAHRDAALDADIRAHLDLLTADFERRGLSPADARAAAVCAFGGVEHMKDTYRDQRGIPLVDAVRQDLRYAWRMLAKSKAFTSVAVLSLALGIGANAAVFSVVDALLLRVMPVSRPGELVDVRAQQAGKPSIISFPMYRDLKARQQAFVDILAGAGETAYRLTIGETELDNQRVSVVTGNYFAVLGVAAATGRLLTPADDVNPQSAEAAGSVIVLSDSFWHRQFSRDPAVVGRTILVGRSPCRVIGVAAQGFTGELVGASPVGWVPLAPFSSADDLENRQGMFTSYIARLRSGVSRDQAQAGVTLLFRQLLTAEGRARETVNEHAIVLNPAATGLGYFARATYETPLKIVMAIVALVLLVACANVANLLLARAAARRGEIAVRLALGCSRRRLVAQLLTESLLLALIAAAVAAGLAYLGGDLLLRMVDFGPVPLRLDLAPGARVLLFLIVVGVGTGVAFGLAPALRATRVEVTDAMAAGGCRQTAGRSRQRVSRALVVVQVALSLLLLVGAGLLVGTMRNLRRLDWGFRPDHVVIFDLAHNPQNGQPAALAEMARQAQERVRQVPGVQSASVSGLLIFSPSDIGIRVNVRDYAAAPGERQTARFSAVTPGYLETVGMTIVRGRSLEPRDNLPDAPWVAVINEAMQRRYFGALDPVGRIMDMSAGRNAIKPAEIVGVVRDAKYNNLRDETRPLFYIPFRQMPRAMRSLEVRTTEPIAAIAGPVRQALSDVSKDIMIRRVVSLSEQVEQSLAAERLILELSSAFGLLALILAAVGLYGVMAYSVAQRTGEIGIRIALGASEGGVVWLVVRETIGLVAAGVAVGIPLTLASTRLVSAFLYGLSPNDPRTIATAVAVLAATGALAAYVPSRRAVRIDPITALRYE